MRREHLDLLRAAVALVAWTDEAVEDGAPALPERRPLHEAAWVVVRRYAGQLEARESDALQAGYKTWRAGFVRVARDLAHPWSEHAVLCCDALAVIDEHLTQYTAALDARRAKGKPVDATSRAKLAEVTTLHECLASYESALARAIGHERAVREAVYWADKLHEQTAGGAA